VDRLYAAAVLAAADGATDGTLLNAADAAALDRYRSKRGEELDRDREEAYKRLIADVPAVAGRTQAVATFLVGHVASHHEPSAGLTTVMRSKPGCATVAVLTVYDGGDAVAGITEGRVFCLTGLEPGAADQEWVGEGVSLSLRASKRTRWRELRAAVGEGAGELVPPLWGVWAPRVSSTIAGVSWVALMNA
jgi:hypothetical protein